MQFALIRGSIRISFVMLAKMVIFLMMINVWTLPSYVIILIVGMVIVLSINPAIIVYVMICGRDKIAQYVNNLEKTAI